KLYITFKTIMSVFMVMGAVFFLLGLYNLDAALISIAGLFAIASFILRLEMKDHLFDPFA
ncbi:MAG: hypothetical protein RR633_18605, partial [Acinetobacter sp.]